MIRFKISPALRKNHNSRQFYLVFREALKILNWRNNDIRCTIKIRLDFGLTEGSGRVIHQHGKHTILLHPSPHKPFPWNTVRHESLHSVLKSKIRCRLSKYAIPLPIPKSYQSQTFRENLEEYCVRALQILFLQQKNGVHWGQKQVAHEIQQGFTIMPIFVIFFKQWRKMKKPFSRKTFIDLIYLIKQTTLNNNYGN